VGSTSNLDCSTTVPRVMAVRSLTLLFGCAVGARIAKKRGHQQVSTCGARPGSPDPMVNEVGIQIVNGRPAPEGSWPWQISLGGCGGTIISEEWVLSAAHCGSPSTATAGLHNRSQSNGAGVQRRSIVENKKHPSYNSPAQYSNDVMLLRVSPPFDFGPGVGAACLPETTVAAGSDCWITGWGTLSSGGSTPSILQEAMVDIKTNAQCDSDYGSTQITDDMICANGNNNGGTTDACQGDSGGPLVCNKGGFWYVEGATSWGFGCANPAYPGVWSRVAYNSDWITQNSGVQPVVPNPTPAPPPTPEPPTPAPGTWELTGSGCQMTGQCISSLNYPANYGNNEECSVQLYGDIPFTVEAFNTESRYDFLRIGGTSYSGTSGPASGSYTGSISWISDYSVTKTGWKLCRTD